MGLKFLNKIPKWLQYFISLGVPLLIIILFLFLYYNPKQQEIKRLKDEIVQQEKEIANAKIKVKKLKELKERYALLKKELEELKRQLPEEKEVTNLLKQVSDLGIKAGLIIKLWKPSNRRTHSSGIVYEIPVEVEMIGSYHKLGIFFSSLTSLERIVNISNIRLSNAKPVGKEAEIQISFDAITFSAIPEAETKTEKVKK